MTYDVLIVGAGVIGGMLARQLSRYELSACLLERENDVSMGASRTKVLHVPNAGIISPYELTIAAVGNAMDNGVALKRNFDVTSIVRKDNLFYVTAADGQQVSGRYLVNCAGGHSDRIAAMAGDGFFTIIPRAGEYLLPDRAEGNRARHTLFQCPTKEGKGILVSPTVHGNLLVGPTANRVPTPDSTSTTPEGLAQSERLAARSVPSIDFRQVGKRVVILGSGDIGLIMARRMSPEGAKAEAVCDVMPYSGGLTRNIVQCLEDFDIPLYLSTTVVEVHGTKRAEGVTIAQVDEQRQPIAETRRYIPCDTLLLSVGLIPENELTRCAGIPMDPVTGGALVDERCQTQVPGIFACGNVLKVHDLVCPTEFAVCPTAAVCASASKTPPEESLLSSASPPR